MMRDAVLRVACFVLVLLLSSVARSEPLVLTDSLQFVGATTGEMPSLEWVSEYYDDWRMFTDNSGVIWRLQSEDRFLITCFGEDAWCRSAIVAKIGVAAEITSDETSWKGLCGEMGVFEVSADAPRTVHGINVGAVDCSNVPSGRRVTLFNTGVNTITFMDESSSAIATERLVLGADIEVAPQSSLELIYIDSRWRLVASSAGSTSSGFSYAQAAAAVMAGF
jgi:hypothetical protein